MKDVTLGDEIVTFCFYGIFSGALSFTKLHTRSMGQYDNSAIKVAAIKLSKNQGGMFLYQNWHILETKFYPT